MGLSSISLIGNILSLWISYQYSSWLLWWGWWCTKKRNFSEVKGSTFLDALRDVKTVIFDKTGTLTEGVFQVNQVTPHNGYKTKKLLKIAAIAEFKSNHPIAKSIIEAYDGTIIGFDVTDYEEISGHGRAISL